ncbi:MAG: hypothetical protein FWE20_01895 [Defluviitaleaceae bacterium]|nr:hypothetical protein [Defluviitaleaceae bacterium]
MTHNNIIANASAVAAVNRQTTDASQAAGRTALPGVSAPVQAQPSFPASPSFNEVLSRQINNRQLQFSKHAAERLSERQIELTRDQMNRVEDGLTRARGKGINDSLVLVDDVALVVNIRNNIVVTAMSRQVENIFTNIDGAVVV